jgi:hypothetical protein
VASIESGSWRFRYGARDMENRTCPTDFLFDSFGNIVSFYNGNWDAGFLDGKPNGAII